ncbi:motility associated factor glycosyltransferase family protein [Ectothiorhodospira variabilis]|uniref:motility associated factor glycosyltransferase family protein n=1 Tax=Ectothiorhodospira variabilis TaxID=505694 RepID=UPI001EFA83F7|nr:DUF115 domain-containing protein [Ectothiorhodospira variabilis]
MSVSASVEASPLFQKNMEALRRRHPKLAGRVLAANGSIHDLEVEMGRRGQPTLKAQDNQGAYYLHSPYDPIREANALVDKELDPAELEVVVLLGVGLGYYIESVLPSLDPRAQVVVVEPDIAAFRLALEHRDITDLLNSERVIWVVQSNHQTAVDEVVRALNAVTIKSWSALIPPAIARRYMAFAKPFVLVLSSALTTLKVHLATHIRAADLFISNTFKNLPYIADAPGIQDVRGAWKGRPVLLISAGPSLDQHLETIRAFKDQILLVAVGQAWRTLRKAGIEPHFIVTVDPFEGNLPHFDGMESAGACLLADAGTHPLVVKQFTGRRIFCHSTHPVDLLMSQVCGERGVLPTGGSVANTAFSFAVNLSADPIILVGQDLAFTGGQTHSRGNAYRQAVDSIAEEKRKSWREVPGYDGGKVTTSSQMDVYRHWFERFILNQPELRVINSTEGGARIEGARQVPLSEALDMFASDQVINVNGLWPSDFEVSTHDELKRGLHSLRMKLSEFKELSEDIVHLSGELGSLKDLHGELQGVPGAVKLNSRLKTRFRKYRRLKHPARIMVEAFTARSRIGAHTVLQKQEKDEPLSSRQGLSLAQSFYRDVAKGCDQGIKLLEQTLDEVHKKMSGKEV